MYKEVSGFNGLVRLLRTPKGRVVGAGVDAETAWAILERARAIRRANPDTAIDIRGDDPAIDGLSVSNGYFH